MAVESCIAACSRQFVVTSSLLVLGMAACIRHAAVLGYRCVSTVECMLCPVHPRASVQLCPRMQQHVVSCPRVARPYRVRRRLLRRFLVSMCCMSLLHPTTLVLHRRVCRYGSSHVAFTLADGQLWAFARPARGSQSRIAWLSVRQQHVFLLTGGAFR